MLFCSGSPDLLSQNHIRCHEQHSNIAVPHWNFQKYSVKIICFHWLSIYGNSKMMHCGSRCNTHSSWGITINSGLYYSLRRLRCLREFLHLHRNKKKAGHCQKSTVSLNQFYPITRWHYQLEFSPHLYTDIAASNKVPTFSVFQVN